MSVGPKNRCTCTLLMPGAPHEDGCAEAPCSNCSWLQAECDALREVLREMLGWLPEDSQAAEKIRKALEVAPWWTGPKS